MVTIGRNDACPCGSGAKLKKCCGGFIDGGKAPTAEALMRSRYTAYAIGAVDYLYDTTHPENPAVAGIDRAHFRGETLDYCRQTTFTGLTIHRTWPEDGFGVARVSFSAALERDGAPGMLSEVSDFIQENGRWLYVRGRQPGRLDR